jgi:hypothetical protein|tara:strand:+ start:763 stop:1011 length:249 start_codon:yes stop_codon:yes gene_type:complete
MTIEVDAHDYKRLVHNKNFWKKSYHEALQRLEDILLNDWPHRLKEHSGIKYCFCCEEDHLISNQGDCCKCGQDLNDYTPGDQ